MGHLSHIELTHGTANGVSDIIGVDHLSDERRAEGAVIRVELAPADRLSGLVIDDAPVSQKQKK